MASTVESAFNLSWRCFLRKRRNSGFERPGKGKDESKGKVLIG